MCTVMHTQPGIHTPETALGKGCEKGAAPVSALTVREEFYSSFFKSFIHWWEKNPNTAAWVKTWVIPKLLLSGRKNIYYKKRLGCASTQPKPPKLTKQAELTVLSQD